MAPAHEVLYRAWKLVKMRGVLRPTMNCADYHVNDEYVITHYPGSSLTIYRKTPRGGPMLSLNLTSGEVAGNRQPISLLDLLRQEMVLDDLARI